MRNFVLVLSLLLLISCGKEESRPVSEEVSPIGPTQPEKLPAPIEPISTKPVPSPLVTPTPSTTPLPLPVLSSLKGYGIQFIGTTEKLKKAKEEMERLLEEMGLKDSPLVSSQLDINKATLEYTLVSDTSNSMHLIFNRDFSIDNETETFVNQRGKLEKIDYASKKEILLALMQRGRTTTFIDRHCSVQTLREHLALRQNISRWGARAWFTFPETGKISTNSEYWDSWTVANGKSPLFAIADAFVGKMQYALACTKAVQLIVAQGIIDYFVNTKKDMAQIFDIDQALGTRPLSTLEPTVRNKKVIKEGSLLTRQFDVPWNNWVPGDWGWIRNDDEESSNTFGGEGSNIIYLGGGYLGSYYDDSSDRTVDEALLRVYRWRDVSKRENISDAKLLERIRLDPYSENGMLRNVRDIPKNF